MPITRLRHAPTDCAHQMRPPDAPARCAHKMRPPDALRPNRSKARPQDALCPDPSHGLVACSSEELSSARRMQVCAHLNCFATAGNHGDIHVWSIKNFELQVRLCLSSTTHLSTSYLTGTGRAPPSIPIGEAQVKWSTQTFYPRSAPPWLQAKLQGHVEAVTCMALDGNFLFSGSEVTKTTCTRGPPGPLVRA